MQNAQNAGGAKQANKVNQLSKDEFAQRKEFNKQLLEQQMMSLKES